MSMTITAVFVGVRSPSYGHGYGSEFTNRVVIVTTSHVSSVDAQLSRRARQVSARRARGDHDGQRHHVWRGVEEIVAAGDADRLQRRPQRARPAEQQRRVEA